LVSFCEHHLTNDSVKLKPKRFIQKFAISDLQGGPMFCFFLIILFYILLPCFTLVSCLIVAGKVGCL